MPSGPPPHTPTPESVRVVRVMTASGARQELIAAEIGIDVKTLRKYYRATMKTAKGDCIAEQTENLYQKALGNSKSAAALQIFYLKTQAGWKETQVHEMRKPPDLGVDMPDGGPGDDVPHT